MTAIQNLRQMFLFRLFAFGIMGIGVYIVFESDLEPTLTYLLMGGAVIWLIVIWLLVLPTYACFDFVQGKIFIGTDKEDAQHFHLVIPMEELAAYNIQSSHFGLRKTIYLFRSQNKQFMRSKGTNISLFTRSQRKELQKRLDAIIAKNGFSGLKFY